MSLFERLKEERERLGYSQEAFARLVGASRKSQIRWEQGESCPDAAALATWAEIGLDVLYVISGMPSSGMGHAPPQPSGGLAPVFEGLNPREVALLDNYRHSGEEGKRAVEVAAAALAKPKVVGD